MKIPEDLLYTKSHEWAKRDGQKIQVGITQHAQEELRDVVFVELPEIGKTVKAGEPVAVVESVKAAFDIYAPVSGTVSAVNEGLTTTPQLINDDCYTTGWMYTLEFSDEAELGNLLSPAAYAEQLKSGAA